MSGDQARSVWVFFGIKHYHASLLKPAELNNPAFRKIVWHRSGWSTLTFNVLTHCFAGDQILAVNEDRLTGLSRNKAIAILRKVEGDVTLLLTRPNMAVAQVNTSNSDKV